MARIENYGNDTFVTLNDKVIGTDAVDNSTKNFTVGDIINLAGSGTNTEYNLTTSQDILNVNINLNDTAGGLTKATLVPSGSITLTDLGSNQVQIASSGEANTGTNLGGGTGVFAQKTGDDLEFKSLTAGANVSIASSATEIQIAATNDNTTYDISSAQAGVNVGLNLTGSDGTTDTIQLIAGTGITLSDNGSNQITVSSADANTTNISLTLNGTTLDLLDSDGNTVSANLSSLTDTNDIDYVSNVALSGSSLNFTGIGAAFSGSIDLSQFLDNTDTIDYVSNVILNGTSLDFTGIGNGFNGSIDLSQFAVDTNDIDYVSNVALSGSSLNFTGIGNAFTGSVDLSSLSTAETLTSLAINANVLTYTDENGNNTDIDLSLYLDDTNLARLTSGTLNGTTGIATFTRDDASTFTVDFSAFLADANNYADAVSFNTSTGVLTIGRNGSLSDLTVDLDGRFLTSFTETDPIFSASPAAGITSQQITNWDLAHSWGDHSTQGYLTSYTETDPIFTAHVSSGITATKISNWDTAYSWGNHASAGYLTSETLTELSLASNILSYRDENGTVTELDLSLYLDDTNLARLTSGTLNGSTGIATFTRDDASTFTVDFSSLIDVDTNTTYDLGAVGVAGDIYIALGGSDSTNDVVAIQAGANITLTDNGSNTFTIDASGGVTTLAALTDTTITTPANGELLSYDAATSKWVNGAPRAITGPEKLIQNVTATFSLPPQINTAQDLVFNSVTGNFNTGSVHLHQNNLAPQGNGYECLANCQAEISMTGFLEISNPGDEITFVIYENTSGSPVPIREARFVSNSAGEFVVSFHSHFELTGGGVYIFGVRTPISNAAPVTVKAITEFTTEILR